MDCKCGLEEIFKKYKGQPIEVITESGMKYCGILVEVCDDESVDIIDCEGRTVHIEDRHIEAIIEPRMKLHRLCKDNDCCCHEERHERHERHERDERDERECDCDECSSFCRD